MERFEPTGSGMADASRQLSSPTLISLLHDLENDPTIFDSARSEAAAADLARREHDQAVLAQLAKEGWAGPPWDIFAAELLSYGFPVMTAWLRTGLIFKLCAERGRRLEVSDVHRQALRSGRHAREDLAHETLAYGLDYFRTKALIGSLWSSEGGASLKTYFVGALLHQFPNVFRRWCTQEDRWRDLASFAEDPRDTDVLADLDADPARLVADRDRIQRAMSSLSQETRTIAELIMQGYTQAEIGEMLGLSEKAVGGRLYRARKSLGAPRAEDGGAR